MLRILWAANRPNYKRWGVKYLLNLINKEESHPGMTEYLQNGAFSVRRTNKNFARTPGDITLEQTINRDAASKLTGIGAYTQNALARKRWAVTRSWRGEVVSALCEFAGIESVENIANQNKPYRIKQDARDRKRIIDGFRSTMNPFDPQIRDNNLYCLSTGKW